MAFVKGAVWGLVVGGMGVAGVSLIAPQPVGNAPPAPPLVAAPVTGQVTGPVTDPVTSPVTDPITAPVTDPIVQPLAPDLSDAAMTAQQEPAAPEAVTEPVMTAPAVATPAPVADNTPAAQPQAEVVEDALTAPDTAAAPDLSTAAEAPVLPNPQTLAPQVPETELDVVIATSPPAPQVVAEPVMPAETVTEVIVLPEAPVAEAPVVKAPVAEAPVADAFVAEAPVITTPDVTEQVETIVAEPVTTLDPADIAPATAEATTDAGPATGQAVETTTPPAAVITQAVPTPQVAPAAPQTTEITVEPQQDSAASLPPAVVSIIDAPPRGMPGVGSGVTVNRPGDAAPAAVAEAPVVEITEDTRPALERYAAFFDNPEGKPLMSVLLIDDGSLQNGPRALEEVPFPITVLLDPAQPDATARMDSWRKAGFEVASLASLPEGAVPTDVAVVLQATFDTLPETVALVDIGGGVLSESETATQVIDNLSNAGRGLVMPEGGLNSALRTAQARAVPAATIYRDLDADDQDARVIRRFVDQAAFRARQEPGVVLLGRVRPETISALILWGTANRAGQVALAPLSATLLAK